MDYATLVETYEALAKTTKRLEKTEILARLLKKTKDHDIENVILLLDGCVFPAWSEQKIGVASQYVLKSLVVASGIEQIALEKEWKKTGDLGLVAEKVMATKKQQTLFSTTLPVKKVVANLQKLASIKGQGSVDRKVQLIAELLSHATPTEAKYVVRTALEVLRVGTGKGTIRDAIAWACFPRFVQLFEAAYDEHDTAKIEHIDKIDAVKKHAVMFVSEQQAREAYNKLIAAIDHAYHMTNDFRHVMNVSRHKGYKGLLAVDIEPFRPVQVMLYQKAKDIKDALQIVGKPTVFEYKYDGFRLQCHKEKQRICLYTRNFEDVTKQFPDVVAAVQKHVDCDSCILDSEVVGYDTKTMKYLPFQHISQRIKRKYDIAETVKKTPVEVNVFDMLYYNGKSVIDKPLHERQKIMSKIIHAKEHVIVLSKMLITDNEKEANTFYIEAVSKGNEGIMAKNLNAIYMPGRRVGFGVKIKPVMESLDLCIVGAEWGEGKRVQWMTSFIIACRNHNDELVTIGKVGTGIKELEAGGVTFQQITELLKKDIIEEKGKSMTLRPHIVIEVQYEEIQKSPTYTSGYALRFPRFIRLRDDRSAKNCSTLEQVEELYKEQRSR
jgi:DNA ligase-1